jgi:segregation and condensation protein A
VARILDDRPVLNRDVFTRGEPGGLEELADCQAAGRGIESTIYDLIEAWHQLSVRRESEDTSLNFRLETKTIGQKLAEIRQFLMEMKSAHFRDLAAYAVSTLEVALSFLAVLELARVGFLRLWQETETDSSGPRLWLADPEASPLEPGQLDYR